MEASNFFTRLLRQPKQAAPTVEPDDLGAFDDAWRTIQETLEQPDERQLLKGISSTKVPGCLAHIVDALVYESNRIDEEALGPCMEYFVRNDLLTNLERLCESDRPHGIKSEVLKAINSLIVLLSDGFLVHNSVHRPLRRLLRSCIGDEQDGVVHGSAKPMGAAGMDVSGSRRSKGQEEELQGELVDLMCTLCSRMRAYPPLLLIFFHDKGWLVPNSSVTSPPKLSVTSDGASSVRPSTKQPHFEFLLFSYLLRFVHREGKIGDFARAGLLFLFDIAFLPTTDEGSEGIDQKREFQQDDPLLAAQLALVEYITDGDFADVMAAGLGATWSLLPSKLRVPTLGDGPGMADDDTGSKATTSGGMILGGTVNDRRDDDEEGVVPLSTDEDVRNQLDMLLKLLGFLQDITTRCQTSLPSHITNADETSAYQSTIQSMGQSVIDQALESVKKSFLDSVLYPSILECSNHDGSAVAIMTYLDTVFSNLDDGRVTTRLLTYLLNVNDRDEEDAESDERYTIRDLLVANLQPDWPTPASATAALGLIRSLLVEHCRVSTNGLLRTLRDPLEPEARAIDTNGDEDEGGLYSNLLSRLERSESELEGSPTYVHYLADMQSAIQDDRCYHLSRVSSDDLQHAHATGHHWDDRYGMKRHKLSPTDPLLKSLLKGLGRFLYASPDENVALTGVIVALATCPYRSLRGWLLYEQPERDPWATRAGYHQTDTTPSHAHQHATDVFSNQAKEDHGEQPAIYQILYDLTTQISKYRTTHRDFDKLLGERRRGLLFTDHLDEAIGAPLDIDTPASLFGGNTTPTRSPVPKKRTGMMGTITSFLTPNRSSPKPSSSPSPSPTPSPAPGLSTPVQQIAVSSIRTQDEGGQSPFKDHYDGLAGHQVEVVHSPVRSGAWSPANLGTIGRATSALSETRPPSSLSRETGPSNLGHSAVADAGNSTSERDSRQVGLSTVLDNIIILEEFVKELVALINARRSLGVEQVRYD